MDGADPSETARRETSVRRQLAELTEHQGWVHHVVDADTGEVMTTPLDRPLAPLSRAERLSRLGHRVDLTNPWGPTYKLTARNPYQSSPLHWLGVSEASGSMPDGDDYVWWFLPRVPQPNRQPPLLHFRFEEPPQRRFVATLVFAAHSYADAVGHIKIMGSGRALIPIAGKHAEHTVDVSFAREPGLPVEVVVSLEPGLRFVVFHSITLQAERVISDPTRT